MTKDELLKMIERLDDKARRNEENYQATGTQRYDYERYRAEQMADALRMALNAKDEHDKLLSYGMRITDFGAEAVTLDHEWDEERAKRLVKNLKTWAIGEGKVRDPWN